MIGKKDRLHLTESVGTESAYLIGYLGITKFNPELVINFGSCGAIQTDLYEQQSYSVGDICYAIGKATYIDRENIFPNYDAYIKGSYSVFI